jgi:hypothetical protein
MEVWGLHHGVGRGKLWIDSLPIDMLFSAVSVLVVALPRFEVPAGLIYFPAHLPPPPPPQHFSRISYFEDKYSAVP